MTNEEFRRHGHALVDWMADYLAQIESYPVKSPVTPGEILGKLPDGPPARGEPFERIMDDFRSVILPGMTHWQHPSFFAYFPANSSPPSVLGEMLTATLGAQCMNWATSPAATELEERVMQWLRQMTGLPAGWEGVIQDTASTATLCSLLTAREARSGYAVNARGFDGSERFTVYTSREANSSVEKAVRIAGIGRQNLRAIEVDASFAMDPAALERAVAGDQAHGLTPLAVVATLGTTGSTAADPLARIGEICRRHRLWLHVDAAYAGTALLLPEYRRLLEGIELADTFVFNPHKWMFTNFDCSAYFVKDRDALVRTFEILPEYLKTYERQPVNNYRDWGIQLGRRFRALKLWFVIRTYGVEGLQERLRSHLAMARGLEERMRQEPGFEILAPRLFTVLCFRWHPAGMDDDDRLNGLNMALLERLNAGGALYLSHTKLNGRVALRFVIAQTNVEQQHVDRAWELIRREAAALPARNAVKSNNPGSPA